jgi:outer membrane lipoprotein LolB
LLSSLLFFSVLMAGCTLPTKDHALIDRNYPVWTGRISLQVRSEPAQAFYAGFELRGNPDQGELTLNSPLGNNLAVLRWTAQEAVLDSGKKIRRFNSVDELFETMTGAAVPLPALFDWLNGRDTTLNGWSADLSQHAAGKISATRAHPLPRSDLRIVLAQ